MKKRLTLTIATDNPPPGVVIFECDADVDGTDAAVFKLNFSAGGYTCPCPSCGPWY